MRFIPTSEASTRPELELLVCCARSYISAETTRRIRSLAAEGLDWDYLVKTASWHGLMPLVYWNLKAICPEAVPKRTLDQLHQLFRDNAAYNLLLTAELLKLLKLFEAQGIPVFTFKGPSLAVSLYGDPALRQFVDLDILVRKKDARNASRLLISQRYQPQFLLTDQKETVFIEDQCEHSFVRDDQMIMVDLHWGFVPLHYSFALDPESLWGRLDKVDLNGTAVLTISAEDLFLFLCIHGAKANHCWRYLSWICDLAELIRVHKDMDWKRMIDRASAEGSERMLFLGLFLASDLLGADLPDQVLQKAQADPTVRSLAAQVYTWLFSEEQDAPSLFRKRLFHLRTMKRFRDRAWFFFDLMTPTALEWQLVPLPRYLSALYYFVRPVRLAGKYGAKLLKRLRPDGGSVD